MSHTPTPWAYTHNKKLGRFTIHHTQPCVAGESSIIGFPLTSLDEKLDEANAAFIVRCVNAHEALVEALDAVVTWMPSGFAPEAQNNAMSKAYAALKLAKE